MSITPDPHDRFVRSTMANKAVAKAAGEIEGHKRAQIEIATKALKEGIEPLFVAKLTQLDIIEVEKLQQQLAQE